MPLSPTTTLRLLRLRVLLMGAALLLLPAAWNGLPLMYPDTPTYLRGAETGLARLLGPGRLAPWMATATPEGGATPGTQPAPGSASRPQGGAPPAAGVAVARAPGLSDLEAGVVLAGRSVYYGALLEAAQLAGSLWWATAVQALWLAWLLRLLLVEGWGLSNAGFLAVTGGLALATPAGLFTGLLMPDIFAGIAILATALLLAPGWPLKPVQRAALALLLLFALSAHASHLATGAVMLLLASTWQAWRRLHARSGLAPAGLALVAACVLGALLAETAFTQAVTRAVGAPPLRLPHLTARLVDQGPGTAYLRQACPAMAPGERWTACNFLGRYPLAWTDFLFDPDPARGVFAPADTATKRRLSQEQAALAWQVLRHDPAGVLGGMAADALRQLAMFRIDIWGLGPHELALYAGRVPPSLMAAMQASRGAREPQWQARFSVITTAAVAASLAGLVLLAWRTSRKGSGASTRPLAGWVLVGLALNAAVCATAAAPLDRFQARVIWLLPLLAAGLALRRTALDTGTREDSGGDREADQDSHPALSTRWANRAAQAAAQGDAR